MVKRITEYLGKIKDVVGGFIVALLFGYLIGTVVWLALTELGIISETFFNSDDVFIVDRNEKVIIWYSVFSMIMLSNLIFHPQSKIDFYYHMKNLFGDKK